MHNNQSSYRSYGGGRYGAVNQQDYDAQPPQHPQGIATERKRHRVACIEEPLSRTMYQLMVAQLYHDGFTDAADAVSWSTGCALSDIDKKGRRLERLVANGLAVEATHASELQQRQGSEVVERYLARCALRIPTYMHAAQLKSTYAVGQMKERFVSSSLGGVLRNIVFSTDGAMVLVGGSGKVGARIFCLETILGATNASDLRTSNTLHTIAESASTNQQGPSGAINANAATTLGEARVFLKHRLSVDAVQFHPTEPFAITGGREGDVFLWSYREPTGIDQPKSVLQDTFPIRAIDVAPVGGEYALVATDHSSIRMAHLESGKALTPPGPSCHSAALSDVHYRHDGRTFVTASFDGSIALHDVVSGKTTMHIPKAHSGVPATSAVFSRTGNIVLSYGMDTVARLWDLRRVETQASPSSPSGGSSALGSAGGMPSSSAIAAQSFGIPTKCEHRIKAKFNAHENLIVAQDSSMCAVQAYDVYSGEVVYSCAVAQHAQRAFGAAPLAPLLVSGGDDCRLRLWALSTLP